MACLVESGEHAVDNRHVTRSLGQFANREMLQADKSLLGQPA